MAHYYENVGIDFILIGDDGDVQRIKGSKIKERVLGDVTLGASVNCTKRYRLNTIGNIVRWATLIGGGSPDLYWVMAKARSLRDGPRARCWAKRKPTAQAAFRIGLCRLARPS